MALSGIFGDKAAGGLDDVYFGRGASAISEISLGTLSSALTNDHFDETLFFETIPAEHGIGASAAAADKLDSPLVITPRRQAEGALDPTHTVLPTTPSTAPPLCTPQHGPHDLLGHRVKEHQLGLPVPAGGAAAAQVLLTNNEHQARLTPIFEELKTGIDSKVDSPTVVGEKMKSRAQIDTPLLEKEVDSLIESGREDLDGVTRRLMSPRDLAKGALAFVSRPFLRSLSKGAVEGDVAANEEAAQASDNADTVTDNLSYVEDATEDAHTLRAIYCLDEEKDLMRPSMYV